MYFRVYLDSNSRWRWALFSGHNERIAISPVSYPSIKDVGRGIGLVMSADSATRVVETESDGDHPSVSGDGTHALQ